tara:strand:- start:1860 stop:2027 length:168 start_codon:yes stop_codon:yes gene_type:complete
MQGKLNYGRTIFKESVPLAEYKHGWQSSYARDCRSLDLGANPGPCSKKLFFIYLA